MIRSLIGTRRRRWTTAGSALLVLAVTVVLVFITVFEGDLPEAVGSLTHVFALALRRFGDVGAYVLLYLEESGVPMPMPGDVFVMYVGHHSSHALLPLIRAWLLLILVVVLGATNLYYISRRWGRRIVERRLGRVLHLTPGRLAKAEHWYARWGPLALIFGRHIPGLRVPLTVGAGIFRVRYSVFAVSVAISTAIWAGAFIIVGAAFGDQVARVLRTHREGYVILPVALTIIFVSIAVIRLRAGDEEGVPPPTPVAELPEAK
jgi:membrane protein DedA with SNARE-associated domain